MSSRDRTPLEPRDQSLSRDRSASKVPTRKSCVLKSIHRRWTLAGAGRRVGAREEAALFFAELEPRRRHSLEHRHALRRSDRLGKPPTNRDLQFRSRLATQVVSSPIWTMESSKDSHVVLELSRARSIVSSRPDTSLRHTLKHERESQIAACRWTSATATDLREEDAAHTTGAPCVCVFSARESVRHAGK